MTARSNPIAPPVPASSRLRGALLWLLAFVLMAGAGIYQRRTGPTYPARGTVDVDGAPCAYDLLRSEETTRDAEIVLPNAGGGLRGAVHWRRYPTQEPFAVAPLQPRADGALAAVLPRQPSAGKLEYHVELAAKNGTVRIPADPAEEVVLRYKDPVPAGWLIAHVATMFVSMMIGLRAVLSALWQPATLRRYTTIATAGLFVGGLVLGPIVQKHAFGAYWTGWPFGYDLTDNKSLLLWLCWFVAFVVIRLAARRPGLCRTTVVLAGVVMIAVYLIPHSLRGSQLDYGKLQGGVGAKEAIETGK